MRQKHIRQGQTLLSRPIYTRLCPQCNFELFWAHHKALGRCFNCGLMYDWSSDN